MHQEIIEQALKLVSDEERGSKYSEAPEKTQAVKEAVGMFVIKGSCLDLGGEPYTKRELEAVGMNVDMVNLSHGDMHQMDKKHKYMAIFARHVLEHSAFPLYMLLLLRSMCQGEMVVVVPKPETEWVLKHPAHVSVLPKEQWEKLFSMAGFTIKQHVEGTWTKDKHVEYRYLLV